MDFIVWVLLSFFILLSVDVFSWVLKRKSWRRFIATFLLFYSQIIATEFTLGLLSSLTPISLLVTNVAISSIVLYISHRIHKGAILKRYVDDNRRIIKSLWRSLRKDQLFVVLLVVALIAILWLIFLGVIFPATDFDGNTYHLTFIGNAIQYQDIFDVKTSLPWLVGYPKGGELIQMWNVIMTRNDMFVDLVQIPFLLLGIIAIYEISLVLGVSKKEARFSSLLFLFVPVVFNQLKTTYVDVMLCSLFFASIAMVLKKKLSRLDMVLVGVIYSLIVSVKFSGFLFVLASLPLLLHNLYKHGGGRIVLNHWKYIKQLLLVIAPMFFGFFWYIKNYVLYGTPLYPFGLKIAGISIFPGRTFQEFAASATSTLAALPKGCAERVWFVWTEQKDWFGCLYNYDTNFAGLGPIWFIIFVPAILISVYYAVKKRNFLYISLTAILGITFLAFPANYYTRYTMFIVLMGSYSLGLVFTFMGGGAKKLVKSLVILLAISVLGTNFALCNFPPSAIESQINSIKAGNPRLGLSYRSTIGPAYIFIQNLIQPDETVAYDSSPYFIYDLWRSDYSNKVTYVQAETKEEWLMGVKDQNVKYVFTLIGSREYGWIQEDIKFSSIYKDDMYEIYQVY